VTAAPRPTQSKPGFDARWLGEVLALAALYFLTARLGLAISGGYVTPVWPPSGIALAAVLSRGRKVWPGIWLGSFAANVWDFYGRPPGLATALATSAAFAIGASFAALLGCQLLRRFLGERNPLERVLDVCAFMALGGVVSCLVSATVGATTLCLAGYAPWWVYGQVWLTWLLGDSGGVFIVAPLLLVWGGPRQRMSAARRVELLGGFGLMIAVTYYAFFQNTTASSASKALTFIILIPFLVWAPVRFGRRGAAAAVGLIALLAVGGTIHQTGPFNLGPRIEALLLLELFLGVMALTALCLAAMFTERENPSAEQQRAVEQLESHVRERTSALVQGEAQARRHLAEAERGRAALLSILEDQREVEEKLRESQTRTQLLVKSSNVGLWDWNLVTNDVFFSPEWKSQLGYSDDEVAGRYEEWEQRLHPEDRASALHAVHDFREGRRADYEVEFRMGHKDGSWRSILTHADLIRDASGQPVRMMGCHIDITARKQAEEALRHAEEQYRSIFNNAVNGIFRTSPDGELLVANPAAARIFGYDSPDESVEARSNVAQLYVDPRRRGELIRFLQQHGFVNGFEFEAYRKDGSRVWISQNTRVIRSPSGEVLYFEGFFQDVTDRKQAEEALNAQALRYKTLMEASTDSIYVLDEKGDLEEANAAFLRRRGYTAAEAKGFNVADWDARWTLEQLQTRLRKLADSGALFETRHRCKDGSIFDVEVCATSVRIGGEQLFFCVARDITERKKADFDLRQLARVSAVSSNYIALIGRDFRYQFVNDTYLKARGLQLDNMIGRHMKEIVGQERFEQLGRPQVEACLRGEEVESFEWTDFRSDFRCFLHVTVSPLRELDGTISGAVMSGRDITGRHEAEEALRESEERFRTIFEQVPLGICEGEIATARFINANLRYVEILGYTIDELRELSFKDYTHPDDLQKDLVEFRKLAAGEIRTYAMEKRYIRKDGAIIWGSLTLTGLAHPGEKPLNCIAVIEDITGRIEAEDRLRRSEEKFKALFDLAPVGIAFLDSRLNIVDCNPALERMTRLSREELWGGAWQRRTFLNADGSPRPPGERVTERAVGEKRLVNRVETGAVMERGDIVWAEVSVAPLALPDASAVVIMQDITERKEAHEQLRVLSRRLFQVQEEERRHLARELHDEIGQALTAVKINLVPTKRGEAGTSWVRLQEAAALVDNLIRQVRQISLDLHPSLLDDLGLAPALRSLLEQQTRRAGLRAQFCATDPLEEIGREIQTTAFRIAQEAITNVLRHGRAEFIGLFVVTDNDQLRMKIVDDGIGFDVAKTNKSGADERPTFGLTGMKERAALLGGEVNITSSPGQGTTVEVTLPITENGSIT